MTTVNQILTNSYDDVIFIPLEAVHSSDSMSFVYKTSPRQKQIVDVGEANANSIIVLEGLVAEEEIYMTIPEGSDEWEVVGWDIYEKVQAKRLEEETRMKEEGERMRLIQEEQKKMKEFDLENLPKDQKDRIEMMMKQGGGQARMMQGGGGPGRSGAAST